MTTPPHTIGYFAIIVPHLDEYQGMFLVDDPALHHQAVMAQFAAMGAGVNPIGALQATIVEGFITGNQALAATTALALYGLTKEKFFTITATKLPGGTQTSAAPMKATTIEEAREELENMASIKAIKTRLTSGMLKRKH